MGQFCDHAKLCALAMFTSDANPAREVLVHRAQPQQFVECGVRVAVTIAYLARYGSFAQAAALRLKPMPELYEWLIESLLSGTFKKLPTKVGRRESK